MSSFSKRLQKILVYFFTGTSILLVVLGITRIKKNSSVADIATPGLDTGISVSNQSANAIKGASVVANLNGNTYQTPWGDLAVAIQVKEGKVLGVSVPTLPNSPLSVQAEPYLIAQAIKAGGSNIQGVSGATITSNAFKASLESAITQIPNIASAAAGLSPVVIDSLATATLTAPAQTAPAAAPKLTTTKTSGTTTTSGVSGTFTGAAYQTPWGAAVASITVSNGKIIKVTEPTVPNSPPSQYAEPYLVQQALAAGSANIQGVSGATYASIAFKSSLESAIAKANATAASQGQKTVAPATTANTSTATTPVTYPRRYHREEEYDD